jgi:hypothetical protein
MSIVESDFDERMKGFNNVKKIKMTSKEFRKINKQNFDVIYIDAIHTFYGVRDDIERFWMITNYFLCGHDYQDKFPGVKRAVDMYKKPTKIFRDTSWLIKFGG